MHVDLACWGMRGSPIEAAARGTGSLGLPASIAVHISLELCNEGEESAHLGVYDPKAWGARPSLEGGAAFTAGGPSLRTVDMPTTAMKGTTPRIVANGVRSHPTMADVPSAMKSHLSRH